MSDGNVTISVTRSAGDDRAVLVLIDTTFPPDGTDGPGLRILVNDDEAFVGVPLDYGSHHEAGSVTFEVDLDDIPYAQPRKWKVRIETLTDEKYEFEIEATSDSAAMGEALQAAADQGFVRNQWHSIHSEELT